MPTLATASGADTCSYFTWWFGRWTGPQWVFLGGGGMSGVRSTPSSPCVLKVNNPLSTVDSRYSWGTSFLNWDTRGEIPLPPGFFSPPFWRALVGIGYRGTRLVSQTVLMEPPGLSRIPENSRACRISPSVTPFTGVVRILGHPRQEQRHHANASRAFYLRSSFSVS